MCSNPESPYLVGLCPQEKRALVIKGDCDLWTCKDCSQRKKNTWVANAIHGFQALSSNGTDVMFVTITSHRSLKDFAATYAAFPHAWSLLYARMKRQQAKFEYLQVMEMHKNGRLHCHMMTSFQAKTRWYKDNCSKAGFGYMAKAERIESAGKCAVYVGKYLGKSLGGLPLPAHFRRVRTSQGWERVTQDVREVGAYDWLVCNTSTSLWAAVEECQARGFRMVEGRTGEYFDYTDACENWYPGALA